MLILSCCRLPELANSKLFKRLLHDRKGEVDLQGFRVTDPLGLQVPANPESRTTCLLTTAYCLLSYTGVFFC